MKTFPWLFTIAFAVLCYSCWLTTGIVTDYVLHRTGYALSNGQSFLIALRKYLLFFPSLWIIYALRLNFRRELHLNAVLTFAGTLAIAGAIVLGAVAFLSVVSVTPILPITVRLAT